MRAKQSGERVVNAADRAQIVLETIVGERLDDHPGAFFTQGLINVFRSPDEVTHIVDAVELGDEVVVLPWKFHCLGHIKSHAISRPFALGCFPCSFDRFIVVLNAEKSGFRERFREGQSGDAFATANVGDRIPEDNLIVAEAKK